MSAAFRSVLASVQDVHTDWWASLKHGGLLIAPAKISEFFVAESLPPLNAYWEDALRREVIELQDHQRYGQGQDENLGKLLDIVLEKVLGLPEQEWQKGNRVDRSWACKAMTGELVKPRRVWQGGQGEVLPVFVADGQDLGGRITRLGIGRGKRSLSRVVEWLRKSNYPVAVLTNGFQWRLIHAGADYDAWCEWDIAFWFEAGQLGRQVTALRLLLGEQSVRSPQTGSPSPLLAAIQSSRQGQGELSAVLGERVRQAVELLIQESAEALAALETDPEQRVSPTDIYIAACRMVMRCVVILFAEARDLLPRENPLYHDSYGIQGLREQLDRQSGGRAKERLRNYYSAWPRLLALFRLVYSGSPHPQLPVPCYGGGLFAPGKPDSTDPILRALSAFENPGYPPSDAMVARILELLCRSKIKVRQGRGNTMVEAPVDFSDLSSEYIGILYEGLLDFELRQAEPDNPMIFLNLGNQPVLPLSRLEEMDEKTLDTLVEKLKKQAKPAAVSGEEDDGEDENDEDTTTDEEQDEEDLIAEDVTDPVDLDEDVQDDQVAALRERTHQWAVKAVKVGKLVSKPRSKKADAVAKYEDEVNSFAKQLINRIILPGEWFLVRWGGTRKGSGTFYTRPQLAVPTVRRTLEPLVYVEHQVKSPKEILALKICDPACGSASFPVAALRYLTEVLWESLFAHGWLIEDAQNQMIREGIPKNAQPEWFVQVVKDFPLTVEKAEEISKARLKRYVVENCIYGVDINPLAVELGRMALWVETANRSLPFTFLDHKIKCGNALVGCWFDRFQDYPVMAWEREGGDGNHTKFVNHFRDKKGTSSGDKWTQAIKDVRNDRVKPEMKGLLERLDPTKGKLEFPDFPLPELPEAIHDQALAVFQAIHAQVLDPNQQALDYRSQFTESEALAQLRLAFDTWCAVWFWEGDDLEFAPTPNCFYDLPEETRSLVERLAKKYQFFHWELEFPDVFSGEFSGFDGVIGNPPWENSQPNPAEYFSNIDPLFRTYGRLEAEAWMKQKFQESPEIERNWIIYNAEFKAFANWVANIADPFGVGLVNPDDRGFKGVHRHITDLWKQRINSQKGFTGTLHPFQLQKGRIFTYKLFLEFSLFIASKKGRVGLIIPSGIYTDSWSNPLREYLLDSCNWDWLFVFENRDGIFKIHRSFKFCPIIVHKGLKTSFIKTAFMRRSLTEWEDAEKYTLQYSREQVDKFSPKSKSILEIQTQRDLEILTKIYDNSVLLGDQSKEGWGIKYRLEFMMNTDAKLFPPRPKWEAQGYIPDEYGHWLKGNWQELGNDRSGWAEILNRPEGVILSRDRTQFIHIDEVEDIALPLYQGVMIWQFDFAYSQYSTEVKSKGEWINNDWTNKEISSLYLMSLSDFKTKKNISERIAFRDVQNATNQRTMIACIIPDFPCGNTVPLITTNNFDLNCITLSVLTSFPLDRILRMKMSQNHINWFYAEELPLPKSLKAYSVEQILIKIISLTNADKWFSSKWLYLCRKYEISNINLYQLWALTPYERLRLRCILDAVVAELYGLEIDDFAWILKECDHPAEQTTDKTFSRTLDPKGFWRVDKEKDPELRHTVLSIIAFHELKKMGLEAFLNLNDGEGWMLPENLRLADYGLGHDDRAKQPQPVTARFTLADWDDQPTPANAPLNYRQRFYPWQLAKTPEESWAECERHADNLRRLLGNRTSPESEPHPPPGITANKQLSLIPDKTEQLGLF